MVVANATPNENIITIRLYWYQHIYTISKSNNSSCRNIILVSNRIYLLKYSSHFEVTSTWFLSIRHFMESLSNYLFLHICYHTENMQWLMIYIGKLPINQMELKHDFLLTRNADSLCLHRCCIDTQNETHRDILKTKMK